MVGAGLNVVRQLGHGGPLPLDAYGSRDGRARPRAEARGGRRDHAGAQRPASGASGLDRIVGVMSASGPYDTMPSNCGRGATMGPSGCSAQSSPVVFRARRCTCLQGLSSSWDDWRGQKVFLIRKRSLVRVQDRPLAESPAQLGVLLPKVRVGRALKWAGGQWIGQHVPADAPREQRVVWLVRTPARYAAPALQSPARFPRNEKGQR